MSFTTSQAVVFAIQVVAEFDIPIYLLYTELYYTLYDIRQKETECRGGFWRESEV